MSLGLLAVFAFAAEPARPPNLIIILADDLGYGDFPSLPKAPLPF